ncbi:kinase-like domain-containing protein [Rhizophagus clarus]|uniref:Kinase-like domain-containing protein n=1 Tax=Rhizophagus clarus TaxID=94130 RepID=A0A8H3LZI5_9GLOM|nr:kinase-like domain-containing protein [Rhizophagus clarus]
MNEVTDAYGITQEPESKDYIIVSNINCKKGNFVCYAKHFQQNFQNWTRDNKDIDNFIRNTQLLCHDDVEKALEWIPYNKFYNINYIAEGRYKANWIDGIIIDLDYNDQNWERENQNMFVEMKRLNNLNNITSEFMNEVTDVYGITQDPESKDYIIVLNVDCKKCNFVCYAKYFQQNFQNWTSDNKDIDNFIRNIRLLCHDDIENALEWIPYNKFYNIDYIAEGKYKANWIDGIMIDLDYNDQNWERENQNMIVEIKRLDNSKNIALEFANKITKVHGITQDPETKDYMLILGEKCKICNNKCNAIHLQQKFQNWTSANWIDGNMIYWDYYNQNWKREGQNMIVKMKRLNNQKNIFLEFTDKITKVYGITRDSKTKDYMLVLDEKCKKCNIICNTIHFQQNFQNWTSGNDNIDKFIQDTQLSVHDDIRKVLEWIPYDKFCDIKCITKNKYKATWIDGNIINWNDRTQNWKRNQHIDVELKRINNAKDILTDEVVINAHGITQDPESKDYIIVLNEKCKKCTIVYCAEHFQQNFQNWTSEVSYKANRIDGNLIVYDNQNTIVEMEKLDSPKNVTVEFINKVKEDYNFYGMTQNQEIKDYTFVLNEKCDKCEYVCYARRFQQNFQNWTSEGMYKANWIDGTIIDWDYYNHNWKRKDQNMIVEMIRLNNLRNISLEFINKITKAYGITQDPELKDYIIVLNEKCKKCDFICYARRFQQNLQNWTSGNDDIDKFILNTQLLCHDNVEEIIEWIPYDKFHNIKYIAEGEMKRLNNPQNIALEFMKEIKRGYTKLYGITQNLETENYIMVLNFKSNERYSEQQFKNCVKNILIQDTILLSYNDIINTLEWIPYNKFYNIKYIAKGGFGKVYRANLIDENWKRIDQEKTVALKSLNNSKNVTLEFMKEIVLHNKVNNNPFIIKFYGVTQDPETKNYMMVLEYAEDGSLRNYLDTNFDKLNLKSKINYLYNIASGLENIHGNEIIHRDLHINNILKNQEVILITDMGLCRPADHNASENTKNNIYGVLPYIAPEILRGQSYTKAADIYSFGIVMYEVISGLPPYYDICHDNNLAIRICKGLRPTFRNIKVPKSIVHLIKKCLDANSLNRPTAIEIRDKLWEFKLDILTDAQKQIIEENNDNLSIDNISLTSSSYKTHPGAIYTSRLLNFDNLPEPKNSDDYYEQNDDIISNKFSGIDYLDSSKWNF